MNGAEIPEPRTTSEESLLRAALISSHRLSPDQVEHIANTAADLGLSFGRAAVQLGILTEDDLVDAQAWASRFANHDRPGPVETAMRRITTGGSALRKSVPASDQLLQIAPSLAIEHQPYQNHSERLRALRTDLMLLVQNDGPMVLSVVSAERGDGRSYLAAELAIAFAQLGRNTLIVDADLRRPWQQQLFVGAEDPEGLTYALQTQTFPQVHPVSGRPNLYVLPTGPLPPNPLELLSAHHLKSLVADWRRCFDFIIIDTPPVSECADALAVAAVAERALLVSRARQTRFRVFRDLLRRLGTTETRIMGAVLNHL